MGIYMNYCKNMEFLNKQESYTFTEYRLTQLNPKCEDFDADITNSWLKRITNDPKSFKNATAYMAVGLQLVSYCTSSCFAESYIPGLGEAFNEILNLLFEVAQYSFLALGIKEFVVKILNGGTVKEGISSSLQYAFGFLFIKMYPTIYNKFAKIKF